MIWKDEEVKDAIKTIGQISEKIADDYGCKKIENFNKKDWEALDKCNKISDGRVRLGRYGEKHAPERGTVLLWTNTDAMWGVMQSVEKGEIYSYKHPLDSNQMLCPISKMRAENIKCYIKELPLYYASLEAKFTGKVSSRQALDVFAEGHGISELLEGLDPEMRERVIKDIREKGWGWFFGS